jgi:hypothetical protein
MKVENEIWVFDVFGNTIPLEAIGKFAQVLLSVLVAFMAYNIGMHDASEIIKWSAYFRGMKTPINSGENLPFYTVCTPEQNGSQVDWDCKNLSKDEFENTTFYQNNYKPILVN